MDFTKFKWTREPESYTITDDMVEIVTKPNTDLWQRTYYHFRNDNAPVFQMETDEKYFSFIVKTDFAESHHRFDQCGIVMYLDSENWLKGSIEYENEESLCGIVSAAGRMIIVSSAPRTESIFSRCASVICTKEREKFSSVSMPALRRILRLRRYFPICS